MIYLFLGLGFQEIIFLIIVLIIIIALVGALIYGIIKLYHFLKSKDK